ncbi:hypothetical protein AVEN_5766-1 [Araneus ventricosus]|uniref:CCHC-type domain-containing protein n=1 Tax=Araneus ventricosus TaxID=182803 RepID=A0A4Y2DVY3_ARAVE|nr:hypothetical protein AVEN_5766-1 [Araneus ventricosus]
MVSRSLKCHSCAKRNVISGDDGSVQTFYQLKTGDAIVVLWWCMDQGPGGLESIIREEVRSTLAPITRNEPAPSPYTTKRRTNQSFWRHRQRLQQDGRRNLQDVGRKTDLWRTSDNVPICFHCGRPGHVTIYCRDRRRVFNEARLRRQPDQYQRWDSDSVSDVGHDPESNYQRYRSASPYPRRNPQRRQSRSPARRSPIRSSEEN